MNVSETQNNGRAIAGTNKANKATMPEQRLELLTHLASELLAAKDPVAVVQSLFHSVAAQFDIDVAFNYGTNDQGDELHLKAYLGIPEAEAQRIEQLAYGQAICGTVAETRRSLYVDHIQQSENPKAQLVKGYGVRVYVCYPLLANDHLLGTLSFASRQQDTFEQEDLDFFRTISQYVALAQERLHAERALRESEETVRRQLAELEVIYETAPVGLCVLDTGLRYVRVNKRLAEINGRSPADHIGRTVREIVPDMAAEAEPLFRQVIETGTPIRDVEISGTTGAQDGAKRSWLEHFYPVKSLDGQVTGINVVVEDITERKQVEASLRESEARFRQLADSMPQLVWTARPDGTIDYYNRQTDQFAGFRRESDSWVWQPVLHPDDRERTAAAWQEAVRTGQPYQVEHRAQVADGTYRWFLSRAVAVGDGQGNIVRWYGTATDIQEQKETEKALRGREVELQRLNETLEERVRNRTEEVRRLAAELTLAEQRERRRIAQILHDDIQQMLVALQINLHLIAEGITDASAAGDMHAAAGSVDELVAATRSLSRELNSPALRSKQLGKVFGWLANDMSERYQLQIELEVDGDCRVESDDRRELIVQLVRELLFNVVKHAEVNLVHLALRDKGEQLVIDIKDNGRGFNVAKVLARPLAAGGLGLFSIRERVGLYGGHFVVESAPGKGTRATVIFPKA